VAKDSSNKPKKKDKDAGPEASPAKSLAEELEKLPGLFDKTLRSYRAKIAEELATVTAWNSKLASSAAPLTRAQLRDIGDMLGLLRKLKIKPEKGRRRDLRKIEATIEDLTQLARSARI
jgi:hypothetical protein